MIRLHLLSIILFSSLCASGQSVASSHWFDAALVVIMDSSNQWTTDASYRTRGERWQVDQLFLRTAFRHTFDEHWKASLGTNITFQYIDPPDTKARSGKEFRLWQELSYEHRLGPRYRQEYRVRPEERWFNTSVNGPGYQALRMRYRIAGFIELNDRLTLQWAEEYLQQYRTRMKFHHNRASLASLWQYREDWQFRFTYYWAHYPTITQHIFALGAQKRIWLHANANRS